MTDLVRVGGATFIDTIMPAVTGDGGAPALHPLGQRVVGTLLRHQAVVDARVRTGQVSAAEQAAAGQRPERQAASFVAGDRVV